MTKETVTISLDTYKRMENKIENLEKAIDDLKSNKEIVTWSRGSFVYSYWFYNASEKTIKVLEAMNEISLENERLKYALKKASANAFYRFFS